MATPKKMTAWEKEVDKLMRRIMTLLELVIEEPRASLLGQGLSMVMTLYFDDEHDLLFNVSRRAMEAFYAKKKVTGDVKERFEELLGDTPQSGEQ